MVPEIMQVVIVGMMILVPTFLIYKKAGFNPLWAALVFLPGFGLLIIFLQLAFWPWPNAKSTTEHD
ncbi:hypothetical protein KEF85_13010 [Methylomonas paludis]|uniref:Uncharacterized protein n=1 Tax=Methylomonas paludis TaxID=1173101 RepID=A0A975MLU9_9GAMM|nr:hypothetical protein [Methylomonas paludis]QWF70253.1 hypothetical protein KEF85_13010 [Methylomonas paludis]